MLSAVGCGLSPEAMAQLAGGGLSDTGIIGSGGSLRDTVSSLVGGQPAVNLGIPFTFGGSIGVEVGATDSPGGAGGGWQPFILISPDFNLSGASSRLTVNLNYSPQLAYYPSSGSQTLLSNNFNGTATAVLVPNWLYLNVRGLTGISSRFGNTSLLNNSFLTQSEAVQTSSFSVSPYLQHTFGGTGTLTVGYAYARTFQDGDNRFSSFYPAPNSTETAGFGTLGDLGTSSEFASFVTGEDFGRIQNAINLSATQSGGSSFYRGSSTYSVSDTLSYAVTRWLTVLGTAGYQEYSYPSANYNLSEPTYLIGVTLTPNQSGSLTVEYGQTAGTNTVIASGTYAPTARTRVFGSYNVGITTGLGARQALLGTTTVGPGGVLLDRTTGGTVIGNTYLPSQSPLSRVKTLSAGAAILFDRDSFSLNVGHTDATQLVSSTDIFGVSTSAGTSVESTFASLGWQHDLNPSTSLNTSISYAHSSNGVYYGTPGSAQDTVQFSTVLNHTFTDTLSGNVVFSHAERFGAAVNNFPAAFGGSASQNVILVGLRKSF